MKFKNILISESSYNSSEAEDAVRSNISAVNLLREEQVEDQHIHPDALTSYYIDYYLAQVNNGGFPQFVYNSRWNEELNNIIEYGLNEIGAEKHLAFFRKQKTKVEALSQNDLNEFYESDYFGENETRDALKDDAFFDLDENLVELNAKWLKNHPNVKVLSIDGMFKEVEMHLGREVQR